MKRLIRYSLGSVAIGSLIVSFVESIRFMLEGLRRKLKVANSMSESRFGRAIHHTCQFCLSCISWIIKSVNRNAYIMVSVICSHSTLTLTVKMNIIPRFHVSLCYRLL